MLYSNCTINEYVSTSACVTGLMGRVSSMATVKKIAKIISIGTTLLIVALYIFAKIHVINSMSDMKRDPIPVEKVEITGNSPDSPYDYGDCTGELPWGVEKSGTSSVYMNENKDIIFVYASWDKDDLVYERVSEEAGMDFFKENNINSEEDFTCYLCSFNSNDISMKYLFKPFSELKKIYTLCWLQDLILDDNTEKVYDIRFNALRVIVQKINHEDETWFITDITAKGSEKGNKRVISFSIVDKENKLTEEDIIHFISTISLKED